MFFLNKGFFHWYIQRLTALFLFLFIFIFFNWYSVFFGSLFLITLFFHIKVGLETFLFDYMHSLFLIFISETLLDFLIIFIIKSIFLLIIFL
jgi:succinate dehydrogenase hydrophobic anchor subunit